MATQKPISTISYNSEAFLREKLQAWYEAHYIQAYQYILHKGEDGDKDHIHLRVEPNKKLDPMELTDELKEYVLGSEKPLGCRTWRPSKEEDWLLYALHDEQYLKSKYISDEKEKLPYSLENVQVSELYDLETMYIRAKSKLEHTSQSLAVKLRSGSDPMELILGGENVFTVNAINRALVGNEYNKLARELQELKNEYNDLYDAIIEAGFYVELGIDDKPHLVPSQLKIK